MRQATRLARRRGASQVEAAIILLVFLTLVLGTLDLGLGVFRYNTVSEASRQGARQAIVHGSLASSVSTSWGPTTYNGYASDGSAMAQAVTASLVGVDTTQTAIKLEWIDGTNTPGDRVRYTVSVPYKPLMTFIFGSPTLTLSAASTMPIAH